MVMETPSPQCVGREFVRQYYTLLHNSPMHLHRFYSHDSSFVHGGVEKPGEEQPPVTGQADIHKKIMSLNFKDCHAKIRQVDSQATVGNAVVVQVTGELSNNGEAMRRFMQTFILAPQSPKKYYVHNDIFRYQDEVFDNDSDAEIQEGVDSDAENVDPGVSSQEVQPDRDMTAYQYEEPTTISNGNAHMDLQEPAQKEEEEEEPVKEEMEAEPDFEEEEEEKVDEQQQPDSMEQQDEAPVEPKAFSWAALAAGNKKSGSAPPPAVSTSPQTFNKSPTGNQAFPKAELKQDTSPQPPRAQRQNRTRDRERSRGEGEAENDSQNARRMPGNSFPGSFSNAGSRYPDNQQLFVGNLPHNIQEDQLKEFFSSYGTVLEMRINTKGPGGKLPFFGFVVFDSPEPVKQILGSKPIHFNDHRLNVEEKKPRAEGGRMGGGRGAMRGGMGGSMRGGLGGRGGARGGMGGTGSRPDRGGRGGGGGSGLGF